jgi:hypothetical protein
MAKLPEGDDDQSRREKAEIRKKQAFEKDNQSPATAPPVESPQLTTRKRRKYLRIFDEGEWTRFFAVP